jgi:hypothetical protein
MVEAVILHPAAVEVLPLLCYAVAGVLLLP